MTGIKIHYNGIIIRAIYIWKTQNIAFLFLTMVHVGIQIHYNGMIRTIIIWKLKKKYYYVTEKNTYRLQQVSKIARLAIQVT